jgi:hypothetical protein
MKRVAAHAISHKLGDDIRTSTLCMFEFFNDENARALSDDETIALGIEGTRGALGSSFRVDSARMAAKPPTPMGVIAASEPPQIMASASPREITRNASPTAWAPKSMRYMEPSSAPWLQIEWKPDRQRD